MSSGSSSGSSNKVIVSCAITGAIHVPSLTPHLPSTPNQIAENAIGAAEAGAAIVHLHARPRGRTADAGFRGVRPVPLRDWRG